MAERIPGNVAGHATTVIEIPSTPSTTPQELTREPSDQFTPDPLLLSDAHKAQFPSLEKLITDAQKPETLGNKTKTQAALDKIWGVLTQNQSADSVQLARQIREQILKNRSSLLLNRLAIRLVKRSKTTPVPSTAAVAATEPTQVVLIQPQLGRGQKLMGKLLDYYSLQSIQNPAERSFRTAFNNILNSNLNQEQKDLLLVTTHIQNIEDDDRRSMLLRKFQSLFPEQYANLEPQINAKAERLKAENTNLPTAVAGGGAASPPRVQERPRALPADPLKKLKASRILPYELLAPHEAEFNNNEALREALEQITPDSINTLPGASNALKQTLTEWFALPRKERPAYLREMARLRGEAARATRPIFPKEIRAAYAQTNSGLTPAEMTRMSQAIAFERAGITPAHYQNTTRRDVRTVYRNPLSLDERRRGGYKNMALPHDMSVHPDEVVTSSAAVLGKGTYKTVIRGSRLTFQSPRKPIAEEAAISSSNRGLWDDILGDTEIIKQYLTAAEIQELGLPGILEHPRADYKQGRLAATELMRGDLKKLAPGMTLAQKIAANKKLAQDLIFLHRKGIVHRDVKPENTLIDRNGIAHVADFGLTQPIGTSETEDFYRYWDKLSQAGHVTPTTDAYGAAKSAMESLFGISSWNGDNGTNVSDQDLINQLQRFNTNSLTEPERAKMTQIRDGIIGVLRANQRIDLSDPRIQRALNALLAPDDQGIKTAEAAVKLNQTYPEFGQFLTLMAGI